jgi:flagellar basal body-associated protein FliL
MSKENEDPILRDEEEENTDKDKRRFRIVSILLVIFTLTLFAGIALDIVYSIKLNDTKNEQTTAENQYN